MTEWIHYVEKVFLGLNQEHQYIQDVYLKKHSESEVGKVIIRDYNPNKVYASTKDYFKIFNNVDDAMCWVNQITSNDRH